MTRSLKQTSGLENKVVGIGCKFFPPLNPTAANKIATLHLCMDTKCAVLQLPHMDYVPAQCFIRSLLANSGVITFVGVELQDMWHKIMGEYGVEYLRSHECKVVDVHLLAKAWFPMSYREKAWPESSRIWGCGTVHEEEHHTYISSLRCRLGGSAGTESACQTHLIGLNMEKPIDHVCRSNWEARVLSLEQVDRYACMDVCASHQ